MDRLKNNGSNTLPGDFVQPGLTIGEENASISPPENETEIAVTPEIKAKKEEADDELKKSQKEREEKDQEVADQLIVINGAKIKFNSHLGEFKVLSDVPTTQDKLTGTIVEKQIPNFTFYDGFQMISLTNWLDFGTVKVQENFVLLKKSFLPGVGKLPGNIPPETGKIEFVDSGQIHVPEKIATEGTPLLVAKQDEEKCFCNRDFTVDEVKKFVKEMSDAEKIRTYALFGEESCPVKTEDKTYEKLCSELNQVMNKHNINTCIRKIHFLAQSYHESSRYGTTLEFSSGKRYNPGKHSDSTRMGHIVEGDGPRYKGRGIIQLTWRKTQMKYFSYLIEKNKDLFNSKNVDQLFDRKPLYKEKYIYYKDKVDDKGKKILNQKGKPIKEKIIELVDVDSASLIASDIHYAFDSAGWYWENIGKTVPTGENINEVADKDNVLKVSQCINGKVKHPYGLEEREKFTEKLKEIFLYPNNCITKNKK